MAKRAMAVLGGVDQFGDPTNPDTFGVVYNVVYFDTQTKTSEIRNVNTYVPSDASVREILNAVADNIIAQQPLGYSLQLRDLIIDSLDRG